MDGDEQSRPNIISLPDKAHQNVHGRKTYASFGKDGVTATANAYGHLIQMTRYFANEPSGFICVDLPETPCPYDVTKRMAELQSACESSDKGMKLDLNVENGNVWKINQEQPKLEFYHDRWPYFTTENTEITSEIHYFISGTTVYQTYTFATSKESEFSDPFPQMTISANLLIRDLDFAKPSTWNGHEFDELYYRHGALPRGTLPSGAPAPSKSVFILHRDCETGLKDDNLQNKNTAILIMSPFIDGRPQTIITIENSTDYQIRLDDQAKLDLRKNKKLEITLAYEIDLISSSGIRRLRLRKQTPAPPDLLTDLHSKALSFEASPITTDEHLNFALRRNLEHILSVCSIPIPISTESDHDISPVAITCGDMAGHRIAGAASFFAFQFLLKGFEHFDEILCRENRPKEHALHTCTLLHSTCGNYGCRMRSRIWKVCRGHLKWIINNMKTDGTSDNTSVVDFVHPHYWVSGQVIDGWDKNSAFPEREITDAPLQIIKFGEYFRITRDKDILENPPDGLKMNVRCWVRSLDQRNRNGAYAFPRLRAEATGKFYLADHALIWWASKSLERLGLDAELQLPLEGTGHRKILYSSDEIKTNIIKRFTVENHTFKKRMIAVSRSSAETRFSLLMRESSLFYAMDLGLFNDETPGTSKKAGLWSNKVDVWTNTVDYQAQQEGQQDAHWDHPLQFALSIIMSAKNKCTNSREVYQMFKYSRSVLLESSSSNGLFPGQLNIYKKPVLFSREIMRDHYWQATFEVPYILWKYDMVSAPVEEAMLEDSKNDPLTRTPKSASSNVTVLSNSVMDRGKIVQLSDEWMYNELVCFKSNIDLSPIAIEGFCKKYEENPHMAVINNAVDEALSPPRFNIGKSILGYIINVPKKSDKEPNIYASEITSNTDLYRFLDGRRTPEIAKKRLLHFCRATTKTALLCYLAASEHQEVSDFFDRHKAYYKYFHDEATVVLNLWIEIDDIAGIPQFAHFKLPRVKEEKKSKSKLISRAVMSFRFDGDFFDRYWTCHLFEFNPRLMNIRSSSDVTEERITGSLKAHPWKQRRILELILFGKILREMVESSQEILEEIKGRILEGFNKSKSTETSSTFLDAFDLFTEITSDVFLSTSKSWNKLQYILQAVEEDICNNLTTIDLWMKRDERPEHDRPRWTINDERNYRGAISRLQKSNDLQVQNLRLCYARAKSFNQSLTRRLESTRSEWEVGSNNDIRLFTYVTVVFLPVSFATSIYSMNGTPPTSILVKMTVTAAVAILVTGIALISAESLSAAIRRLSAATSRAILYVNWKYNFIYLVARYIYWPLYDKFSHQKPNIKDSFNSIERAYLDFEGAKFQALFSTTTRGRLVIWMSKMYGSWRKQRDLESASAQSESGDASSSHQGDQDAH
ncbi:hypothetical protein V8C43DRAFT_323855 [Trichoderma afarasin]